MEHRAGMLRSRRGLEGGISSRRRDVGLNISDIAEQQREWSVQVKGPEYAPATSGASANLTLRYLLDKSLLTEHQIQQAITASERDGVAAAIHLVLQGALTRSQLFQLLASRWGLEFIDLEAQPPDIDLVRAVNPTDIVGDSWIPWRRTGQGIVIAMCVEPTAEIILRAEKALGTNVIDGVVATDLDIERNVGSAFQDLLAADAADGFAEEHPTESARGGLRPWQKWLPCVALCAVAAMFLPGLNTGILVLLAMTNAILVLMLGVKLIAGAGTIFSKAIDRRRNGGLRAMRRRRGEATLPVYSILVPAYREANVIGRLMTTINQLDYPAAKLDVIVLLEADDIETQNALKAISPPPYVRVLIVPPGPPRTKPRACNFGLRFAKGEYVVVFDAEDRPDPGQLRAAIDAFESPAGDQRDSRTIGALQCGLHFFNAHHNVLSRMFAIEYAFWFDAMLPGFQRMRLPIPLGGTSNHFRVDVLRKIGGWDAYNVTEDADLGLRIGSHGYRVEVLQSNTWEEACAQVPAWIRQRTRWIKGYMMTGAVNTRNPVRWIQRNGWHALPSLLFLIGGTPFAFLSYPLLLLTTLVLATPLGEGVSLPSWFVVTSLGFALSSHLLMILSSLTTAWRRYDFGIAVFAFLLPAYWLLHSIAAYRALWQLYVSPFRWEKTPHGLTDE